MSRFYIIFAFILFILSIPLSSHSMRQTTLLKSTRSRSVKDVTVLGSKIPRQGPTSFKGLLRSIVFLIP